MDRRTVATVVGVALVGAVAGWVLAGALHAWKAPPVPPMPPLAGLSTIVFDAEVFSDEGLPEAVRRQRLEAVRDFLETKRPHDLACAVRPSIAAARGLLTVDGVDSGAFVVLGRVYLTAGRDAGEGTLRFPGYEPATVSWTPGPPDGLEVCAAPVALVASDVAAVVGVVRGPDGAPLANAAIDGCGGTAVSDADGAYYLEATPGTCALVASGANGPGAPVPLQPAVGQERVIDLVAP